MVYYYFAMRVVDLKANGLIKFVSSNGFALCSFFFLCSFYTGCLNPSSAVTWILACSWECDILPTVIFLLLICSNWQQRALELQHITRNEGEVLYRILVKLQHNTGNSFFSILLYIYSIRTLFVSTLCILYLIML